MVVIRIERLSLAHFRNYRRQDVELSGGITVLHGDNAQGKSNLLEACYLLATTRPVRAGTDRELVGWTAVGEPLPYARVTGRVSGKESAWELEVVLQATQVGSGSTVEEDGEEGPGGTASLPLQRSYRLNGVRRRAVDMAGLLKVVLFGPEDVELVAGPPALRRRYLDLAASQLDRRYLRALQRFQRIVSQRNALLRHIREGETALSQLVFWDEELVRAGSFLLAQRLAMLGALEGLVRKVHSRLTEGEGEVSLAYDGTVAAATPDEEALGHAYLQALRARQGQEIAAGQTLVGPHRDDLRFLLRGVDMGVYGSRGQRRTLALSLKLAEAEHVACRAGEAPVLLLDDVLSELDPRRRAQLLESVTGYEQALITTIDLGPFPPPILDQARLLRVAAGRLEGPGT